jgi:hypothetical protein
MMNNDTVAMLCEWGKWSRSGFNSLGAKSASLIVMQLVQPASEQSPVNICDDDALRVDYATAMLRRYDAKMFEIIELYFLHCLSMKEIELKLRLTRGPCKELFSRACGWLECELQVKDQVA